MRFKTPDQLVHFVEAPSGRLFCTGTVVRNPEDVPVADDASITCPTCANKLFEGLV